jgi:EF hand
MRSTHFAALTAFVVALSFAAASTFGQSPPNPGNGDKDKQPKPPPDEFRAILKQVEEAYKAPLEVDKDILDELRKQYRNPTPDREAKIFKEIRRLYDVSAELESAITAELRRAYQEPSAAQEERIFAAIRQAPQHAVGAVPAHIRLEQSAKLFSKLDANGDGVLDSDEMPDTLRGQRARWDQNRNGSIDFDEYAPYYQSQLKWVSDGVASGEIPLKLPKGAASPSMGTARVEERPAAPRAGPPAPGLPGWFTEYDVDADGQVGLYEWRKKGQAIKQFLAMDRNNDGFLEAKELLAFLAEQKAQAKSAATRR